MPAIIAIIEFIKNNKWIGILIGILIVVLVILSVFHLVHSREELKKELIQEQISNSILLREEQKEDEVLDQYHKDMEVNLAKTKSIISSTTKTLDENKTWSNTPVPQDLNRELN